MANIKISELPAATVPLAGSELVPIVQSGTTGQVTVANLTAGRTVNAAAVTASGTVSGATVTASGTVSGATVTASGTVSGATVTASGTVSGTTVSGTTVVVGAGTAAAPSISPTGDTNTGMFFPAADTIAFAEGGTEVMRIDSAGNVGIGTSTPGNRLDIVSAGSSQIRVKDGVNATAYYDFGRDGTDGFFGFAGAQTTFSGYKWSVNAGTEVMRITNAGNVGIGTSSPGSLLTVNGNLAFNSGYGSAAVAYGCRAWVNFNGTGTVAIRASGNVSSITDNGVGDYTVNFTTAMPDVDYTVTSSAGSSTVLSGVYSTAGAEALMAPTTSAYRIRTVNFNGYADLSHVYVAIFR